MLNKLQYALDLNDNPKKTTSEKDSRIKYVY